MGFCETQQPHTDAVASQPASSNEWQNLALDTLARLTREFAIKPDCNRLVNLILLSMTGQLSATGAFACFVSAEYVPGWPAYRGSGTLHSHRELQNLLQHEDYRQFFLEQSCPFRVCDLLQMSSAPGDIRELLTDARVAAVIPLIIGESLLGLLGLALKVDHSQFSDNDLSLMGTLADTVSPLLNNSLLYAKLDSLNQWHRDIIDSVRQGVLVFTDGLALKQANVQARQLFSSIGKSANWDEKPVKAADLFDDRVFPGWLEFIRSAVLGGSDRASDNLMARVGDDDRIFLVRVSRTSGMTPEATDVIVTFDEVTEQRNNEQRMFEMEKFAEKGVMAASIAHELNNHLALILGGIELVEIASGRKDFQKTKQSLEKLKTHSLTMERFTAGLTDYSRLDSEKTSADLNKIVKDVLSFARVQKRFAGITLNTHLAVDLPTIVVDVDQMAQLLMNLLNNAADAIRDAENEHGIVNVSTSFDNTVVSLGVSDNGIGIPEELKGQLFKSRFTTKDYGHGFGMVTCGRILERHDAFHTVESEAGRGTSIRIHIPVD